MLHGISIKKFLSVQLLCTTSTIALYYQYKALVLVVQNNKTSLY